MVGIESAKFYFMIGRCKKIEMKKVNDNSINKQKEEIKGERMQMQDDSLREQIRSVDHIVAGRVLATKRLPIQTTKESEHDPVWTEAEIEVDESLKGNFAKGARVKITFAASNDIMWVRSPKFIKGQSGIYLLKKSQEDFIQIPNFVIADRSLFLDIKNRENIRRAMQ